jgi:hypothetical protein
MGLWGLLNPHLNDTRNDAKRAFINNWLDNIEPFDEEPYDYLEQSDSESDSQSEPEADLPPPPPPIQYLSPVMRRYDLSAVSFSPWRNAEDSALQSSTPYGRYAAPYQAPSPAQGGPSFSYSRRLEPVPYPTFDDSQGESSEDESEQEEEEEEDEDDDGK